MTCRFLVLSLFVNGLAAFGGPTNLPDQIRAAQNAGNYARAAQLYQELIAQGVDTPEVRSNRGIMLHLAGRNREALNEFQTALGRNPSLVSATLFAGLAEFDLHEYRRALPYLERAEALDPQHSAPAIALAKTQLALRDFPAANTSYKKAAGIEPNSAEAWFGIGITERAMADALLNQAARSGSMSDVSVSAQAHKLLDDALLALSNGLELEPASARAHLLKAEALGDQGKLVESVAEYQTALRLDPAMEGARLGLATEYWKNRQFEEARPLLQRVLANNPKDPEANGIMADIAEHQSQNTVAEQYAKTALAGNPSLIETRLVLARVYLAENKPDLAIRELTRIAAADSDGSYHFLLYRAYHQAGNEAAAQSALAEYHARHSSAGH